MLRLISSLDDIRTACGWVGGGLYLTSRQMICVSVCEQSRTWYVVQVHEAWERNGGGYTTFCKCTRTHIFARQARRGARMTFIHLPPCKVHQLLGHLSIALPVGWQLQRRPVTVPWCPGGLLPTSPRRPGFDLSKVHVPGADKSLARPGMKQAPKHFRDARDFNNIEMRAVIKSPLQGKAPKEIHAILTETLACFLSGRAKDLPVPL